MGTDIDDELSSTTTQKASQSRFLMRKLREFKVSPYVLKKVYVSLIQSVLVFNITVWCGHLTPIKLNRVMKTAGKIVGRHHKTLDKLYSSAVYQKQ